MHSALNSAPVVDLTSVFSFCSVAVGKLDRWQVVTLSRYDVSWCPLPRDVCTWTELCMQTEVWELGQPISSA
jgi:hypothetical protein